MSMNNTINKTNNHYLFCYMNEISFDCDRKTYKYKNTNYTYSSMLCNNLEYCW